MHSLLHVALFLFHWIIWAFVVLNVVCALMYVVFAPRGEKHRFALHLALAILMYIFMPTLK